MTSVEDKKVTSLADRVSKVAHDVTDYYVGRLKEYTRHSVTCNYIIRLDKEANSQCTCGLDALLKEIGGE